MSGLELNGQNTAKDIAEVPGQLAVGRDRWETALSVKVTG